MTMRMMSRNSCFGMMVLASVAGFFAAEPAFAQTAAPPLAEEASLARADSLYRDGNNAYDRGDYAAALSAFSEAFALKPSFDIAGNLGQVELKLGKYRDAAEHLAFSVRVFPPNGKSASRDKTVAALREARTHVAALTIRVTESGADISIGDRNVGRSPIAHDLFVDPGLVTISARLGAKSAKRAANVPANSTTSVVLELVEDRASTPPIPGPQPVTEPPPGGESGAERPLWPGIALVAAGGVGLGVGIGLFVAGSGGASDAEDLGAAIGASGSRCDPPAGPRGGDCAQGFDDVSSAGGLRTGGVVAMGVGGAVAVGGAIYLIWASASDAPPQTSGIRPWVSTEMLGGAFQSSF